MQAGFFVYLHVPKAERVRLITEEYGQFDKKDLCAAIDKLSQRLSLERLEELKALVINDRFPQFAELMLDYYDRSYHYSMNGKEGALHLQVEEFDAEKVASQLNNEIKSSVFSALCQMH